MFDWKFVFPPLPLIFILSYGFFNFVHVGDYNFHLTNTGDAYLYPSGIAHIMNALGLLMPRSIALHSLMLLLAVVLPYILVFKITKSQTAAWVYLYGTNIPTLIYSLWFVPQAAIHVFMLLSLAFPPFILVFAVIGDQFHHWGFFACCVTAIYMLARHKGVFKWLASYQ